MPRKITKTEADGSGQPQYKKDDCLTYEKSKEISRESRFRSAVHFQNVDSNNVDRENGIIRNVSVNTVGEALGHGVWLEQEFVDDVSRMGAEKKNGIKSRFGHPNMCSSAIGTGLGRLQNFRVDGEQSIADLHLSESSKKAPMGDLYEYVLTLAENDSDMFGLSIVFDVAYEYRRDENGDKVISPWWSIEGETREEWDVRYDAFYASDSKTFVSIAELRAADVVDDPAANPDGLFESFDTESMAAVATKFLDSNPQFFELLDKHPEVLESFKTKYKNHKLTKGQSMADEEKEPAKELESAETDEATDQVEESGADETAEVEETETVEESEESTETEELSSDVDPVAEFCKVADEHGYAFAKEHAGKSNEEILLAANAKLKEELSAAKSAQPVVDEESAAPVGYSAGESKKKISMTEVRKRGKKK